MKLINSFAYKSLIIGMTVIKSNGVFHLNYNVLLERTWAAKGREGGG